MTLRIEVDGETVESQFEDFLAANECLDGDEADKIQALDVGETYAGGGGAGALWFVTRLG